MHTNINFIIDLTLWMLRVSASVIMLTSFVLISYVYMVYRLIQIQRENTALVQIISVTKKSFESTIGELKDSKDLMTGQIQFMSLLLTSITHDVLSPLRYVVLTASGINDLVLSGQTNKAARLGLMIADASTRTSNLLEDMLDYFKIQFYGNAITIEKIYLRKLIDSKVKIFKGAAEGNDTQIKVVCPTETMVATDYHLLSIIIHNLLDNACKYTKGGVILIDVHSNLEGKTELNMTNTGSGLSTKMIEFINQHEEQMPEVKNTSEEKRISGLGLYIVKELVKLLAIHISVQQEDKTHFKLVFSGGLQAKNQTSFFN